ncbi:SAM-dependent methyltransferase [Kineosphaera limosa]|uniref:Putative methyltransferase n=1 Tax=Kineosphaera limosa NBRC 100340 TaxID=1184609 RepID=K6VDY5_9MICO|nr:class I SAM-dependent methyltransferase [Kineosphaera limosa]NYE03066.1 SAM-dependent methyltransferase [Kineosphaera limosa]GAB94403.1 putative methyltransferase [Kineosphaera limosa NBRC 100340]
METPELPDLPDVPDLSDTPEPQVARATVDPAEAVAANRGWWDANAAGYYAEHGDFLGDARLIWGPEGWSEEELGLLGEVAGRDVLEIGAGAAQGARSLRRRGARAVASDLSGGMLATAATIDQQLGSRPQGGAPEFGAVPLVQCDGRRLPFADASFDIVFTAYGVLPFVADGSAVFAEAARVLRPGGLLVAAEPHPIRWCFPDVPGHTGLTVSTPYWDRRAYTERAASGRLEYAETHPTMASRIAEIVAAGLSLEAAHEPQWPEHNPHTWGGWSPLRGEYLPGTVIWVARSA